MHGKEFEDRLTNLVYANCNVMSTPFFPYLAMSLD